MSEQQKQDDEMVELNFRVEVDRKDPRKVVMDCGVKPVVKMKFDTAEDAKRADLMLSMFAKAFYLVFCVGKGEATGEPTTWEPGTQEPSTQNGADAEGVDGKGDGAVNSTKTQDSRVLSFGNAARMREALEEISRLSIGNFTEPIDGDSSAIYQNARWVDGKFVGKEIPAWWGAEWANTLKRAIEIAQAALAAKPRNCDVGTIDEQIARLNAMCSSHLEPDCSGCPVCGTKSCALAFAQMPYTETQKTGGDK